MSAAGRRRGAQANRRAKSEHRKSNRTKLVLVVGIWAVAAVAALVVLGGFLRNDNKSYQHSASSSGFILGSADAPVLLTAWEDFQCPICKQANATVMKQIEQDYVNTGKVRVQFRQFPFIGKESTSAAEASQCAADQGKFWNFETATFAAQRAENSGALSNANLKKIAAGIGVDTAMFNNCVDNDFHKDSVQAEKKIGTDLGVKATPTFFVNGKQVADWRNYDSFKAMIDQALASQPATQPAS